MTERKKNKVQITDATDNDLQLLKKNIMFEHLSRKYTYGLGLLLIVVVIWTISSYVVQDGVVDAFYPGPHGAQAIADVLFGEYSPSGRSPITFYKSTSDLPALDEMNWYPSNVSNGIR